MVVDVGRSESTYAQHVVAALERELGAADGEDDRRQGGHQRAVHGVLAEHDGRRAQRAVQRLHLGRGPGDERRARVGDGLAALQPAAAEPRPRARAPRAPILTLAQKVWPFAATWLMWNCQ